MNIDYLEPVAEAHHKTILSSGNVNSSTNTNAISGDLQRTKDPSRQLTNLMSQTIIASPESKMLLMSHKSSLISKSGRNIGAKTIQNDYVRKSQGVGLIQQLE